MVGLRCRGRLDVGRWCGGRRHRRRVRRRSHRLDPLERLEEDTARPGFDDTDLSPSFGRDFDGRPLSEVGDLLISVLAVFPEVEDLGAVRVDDLEGAAGRAYNTQRLPLLAPLRLRRRLRRDDTLLDTGERREKSGRGRRAFSVKQSRWEHWLRSTPGPPRFVMSRQNLHLPHSPARQPVQTPHRFLCRRACDATTRLLDDGDRCEC